MNSKAKGGSFERLVCKSLSLWISHGKNQDVFWRSAMSGGRATVSKGKVRQCGDICAVAEEGYKFSDRFYIECKHIKKAALDSFLIKRTGPLATFWKKAEKDAAKHLRQPLLIFRQNGWPILVLDRGVLKRAEWATPVMQDWTVTDDNPAETCLYRFDDWMKGKYHDRH